MPNRKILHLEDAQLIMNFRNFRGLARGRIPAGTRNFCVYIPDELVDELRADDWTLIEDTYNAREGEPPKYYIRVRARFDKYPPRVRLQSNNTMVDLTEETIGRLDTDDIEYVEMDINGSLKKDSNGNYTPGNGRTAYLSQMFVRVKPDWFEEKYGVNSEAMPSDEDTPF